MADPRFADWPWRDWGEFGITRERAQREAERACVLAEVFRVNAVSRPWRVNPAHRVTAPKKARHWRKPQAYVSLVDAPN